MTSCTLSGGYAGYGGAVGNNGSGTITGCTFAGNYASGSGGGISNRGTLTMSGCTVSGDRANSSGGGFQNTLGTLTMTGCTLSGDYAGTGTVEDRSSNGGAGHNVGTLTMTGCTISGDSAENLGGGISNFGGTLRMTGCTVSGDSAPRYGGLYMAAGSATLTDTIVAANTAVIAPDIGGSTSGQVTGTFNLIGYRHRRPRGSVANGSTAAHRP